MERIPEWIMHHGYVGLFGALMLGILGLPVPDELILTGTGYLVFRGNFDFLTALAFGWAGSCCGITLSYGLGRIFGENVLLIAARLLHVRPRTIEQATQWFHRFGKWSLTFGYFFPGVRHFTALIAGTFGLRIPQFALFAYLGALLWSTTFLSLGYFLGHQWRIVSQYSDSKVIVAAILVFVAAMCLFYLLTRRKTE